jgi:site-specific recombinase
LAFGNRKRKYYKNILFCASGGGKILLLNIVK